MSEWLERVHMRRLTRHAKSFLRERARGGDEEAAAILHSPEMLEAFCDECIVKQSKVVTGSFADIIQSIIDAFLADPEAFIAIIQIIIALFGRKSP